ncbi:MAG: hypothetical protein R6U88_00805 [Candidatus Bipolaricaulota bacterium]
MYVAICVLLSVPLLAFGQGAHLDAPWLTVYDVAGRPRWEVELEELTRDDEGWHGQDAHITLYHEGEPQAVLLASQLVTDALGREWNLREGVEGVWGILKVQAERAHWDGDLTMWEVDAQAEDMTLTAAQAHWSPGAPLELSEVWAVVQGWELSFATGNYEVEAEVLFAQDVDLRGHGLEIGAVELRVSARGGEVTLTDAQLVPID